MTNIDLCIAKLQLDIDKAKGATFVITKTALLEMAVRALEEQKAYIAALEARTVGYVVEREKVQV